MTQFYGKAGRLEIPITIDGVEYSGFVAFNSAPDAATDTLVLSSRLTSWSRSGGVVTGVVERQRVVGAILNEDNVEVEVPFFTGNTLGVGIEPQRFYSKQSPEQSIRGGKRCARVGQVFKVPGEPRHQGEFPVSAAEAYAVSAAPRWQQGEAARARYTLTVNMNPDLVLSEDATEVVRIDAEGGAADAGLYIFSLDSSDYERCTRHIFDGDEGYYPADATFPGVATWGEYWFNPVLTSFTLASQNQDLVDVLADEYRIIWYVARDTITESAARLIFGGTGGDGYGTPDELTMLALFFDTDVTRRIRVYRLADGSWPTFGFELRTALDLAGSRVQVVSDGMELTCPLFLSPQTLSGSGDWFEIEIERAGSTLNITYKPDGGSDAPLVAGSVGTAYEWMAITAWGGNEVGFEFPSPTTGAEWFRFDPGTVASQLWERHMRDVSGVVYEEELDLQDTEAIDDVRNLTADTTMASSSTPARDHYDTGTGTIIIYAEADRDQIRITHEEGDPGDPDAVGIAPEQFFPNTKNMATTGNSTAGANRAYWQDAISFPDPHELFDAPQDTEFELHAQGCWDPDNLPTLGYSYKGSSSASWTAVGTNGLALPGPMMFLLKTSFLEGLSVPLTKMCWYLDGDRVLAQGSVNGERQINVLIRVLQAFDDCWLRVSPNPTYNPAIFGGASIETGVTEFACAEDNSCRRAVGVGWGAIPNLMPDPVSWPFEQSGLIIDKSQDFTPSEDTEDCGGMFTWKPKDLIQQGLYTSAIGFGAPSDDLFGGQLGFISNLAASATFQFRGLGLGVPREIARLPHGSTILEAYGLVQFSGLSVTNYTYNEDDGIGVTYDTSAGMAFNLVAARRRRRTLPDGGGNPTVVPDFVLQNYGVGATLTASDGNKVINMLAILEAILAGRGDRGSFLLWPAIALSSGSAPGVAAYIEQLLPSINIEITGYDGCDAIIERTASARTIGYTQMGIANIMMRVRVPAGLLDHRAFPKVRPALVPY